MVTNWLLTMDCYSQLKSHFSKSAGNMATVSNSPPRLEPSPSSSKLVDKTGSKGKTWSYFADRAHQNKYPVDMLEIQRQTWSKAGKVRCSNKMHGGCKCDKVSSDNCSMLLLLFWYCRSIYFSVNDSILYSCAKLTMSEDIWSQCNVKKLSWHWDDMRYRAYLILVTLL